MPTVTQLPFDLKGTKASNKRSGEEHTLTKVPGKKNRVFTPEFGAYYTESLDVRTSTGVPLVRDKDYVTTYYYSELGELSSKEICALIVVINPDVGNDVRISYQAVGGPYSLSVKELADVLTYIDTLPKKIKWEDIVDKPYMYQPADHTHEYWQLYGLESTVVNLDLLGDAIAQGRTSMIDDNRAYYQDFITLAQAAVDSYRAKVNAHIGDTSNPHQSDKVKIQLGNINNWAMANATESESTTINNRYMPIGGIYNQIVKYALPSLNSHIANKLNPHQVNLSDPLLNLWNKTEINNLFAQKLHRTQSAANSNALAGLPSATIYGNIRTNLGIENVNPNTRFPQSVIAYADPNWAIPDYLNYLLVGNNTFRYIPELMDLYGAAKGGVYFVGSDGNYNSVDGAINKINTYSWVPEGTWVIGAYSYLWFGAGRVPVYTPFLVVCRKNAAGGFDRLI